ncbi:RNA methyltransferase tRNA(m5U54)methyltransferase [Thelotrema lepadinum]|nr:RNA methyltransferase tRNA(m5U54)methyltransferase [Thelotrema lepadinum]
MGTKDTEVEYEGSSYRLVTEGEASILNAVSTQKSPVGGDKHPKNDRNHSSQTVFYNPIQQFNRDLSVLAIRVFAEDLIAIRQQKHGKRKQNVASSNKRKTRDRNDGDKRVSEERLPLKNQEDHLESENVPPGAGAINSNLKRKRDESDGNEAISDEQPPLKTQKHHSEPEAVPKDAGKAYTTETELPSKENDFSSSGNSQKTDPVSNSTVGVADPKHLENYSEETAEGTQEARPEVATPPKGPKSLATSINWIAQIRVLDALSATGLRALRYAKEIPEVTSVTANDISPKATSAITVNVRYNDLRSKINIITGNAIDQLHRNRGKYEVVDLDPYGTAAPFLDAAVQSLSDGGLLCVTCTDSGVFASTGYLEKCFSQYGGVGAKGGHSHEVGIRVILHTIATSAARYGLAIEPLLSLSIDFYVRIFVKIRRSPEEVKLLASKTMVLHNCDSGCGAWTKQFMARTKHKENKKGEPLIDFSLAQAPTAGPTCEHCGFKTHLAGPMWGGPTQNPYFIQKMLDILQTLSAETYGTIPRMEGMLTTARDETLLDPTPTPILNDKSADADVSSTSPHPLSRIPPDKVDHHPLFFLPSTLAGVIHCVAPSANAMRGAILGLGYRATRVHTKPGSIRTDAPWSVIWEIMREWVRQRRPLKEGAVRPGSAGWAIMQHDRSKSMLNQIKTELKEVAQSINETGELKVKLESLLWRLGNADSEKAAVEKTVPEDQSESECQQQKTKRPSENEVSPEKIQAMPPRLSELEVNFDERLGQESEDKKRLLRYQFNPRPNWGPMTRAKG